MADDKSINYYGEMEGSKPASNAAVDADVMAEDMTPAENDYLLPRIPLASGWSLKRSEKFGERMINYDRAHGTSSWVYRSMNTQMTGYINDYAELQRADLDYNMFVGPANMAVRASVRTDQIDNSLDSVNDWGSGTFDDSFKGQSKAVDEGIGASGMRSSVGLVTDARNEFRDARNALRGHTEAFNTLLTRTVVGKLRSKIASQDAKRADAHQPIRARSRGGAPLRPARRDWPGLERRPACTSLAPAG